MKHIVLCSNHPVLIAGFQHAIGTSNAFFVSVQETEKLGYLPRRADVVVIDVTPELTLERIEQLTRALFRLVLWVDNAVTEFVAQALALGVMGILRKSSEFEAYIDCLEKVSEAEIWVEAEIGRRLLSTRTARLTNRERQIIGMLARGYSNKELGFRLGITEGTVKFYLSRLYVKVGATDRFELALVGLKNIAFNQTTASANLAGSADSPAEYFMPSILSLERSAHA